MAIVLRGGVEAVLRPLTGADEAFLLDEGTALLPAQRTTWLLCRCLVRLGPSDTVTPEAVRALTVGDREALVLHLRRLTLGERVEIVLRCPQPGCGEKMDLDLAVADLLFPPAEDSQPFYEAELSDGDAVRRVRYRLPTGADHEAAALLARSDLGDVKAAADLLLRRCVEGVEEVTDAVGEQLSALMAQRDPQAELVLKLTCPACGRDFDAPFDAAGFFFQELAGRAAVLYREVHRLALAYHWSEAEILALNGRKRRLYLDLLAETAEAGR
jgi:hypothetical protein